MKLDVPIHLRWADLDAYNHVNNVEIMRLFEEARVRAFWKREPGESELDDGMALVEASAGAETMTLIGSQRVEYLLPVDYRQRPIIVRMWIGALGGASMDVFYELRDSTEEDSAVYARALTTIVLVTAATGRPRRIGAEERAAWGRYLEAPLSFRGRE